MEKKSFEKKNLEKILLWCFFWGIKMMIDSLKMVSNEMKIKTAQKIERKQFFLNQK